MAIQDTDFDMRKDAELAAGIPLLPRFRERICILCGIGLGMGLGALLYYIHKDKQAFYDFKRAIYLYDIFVDVLILIVEIYSLSYYHPKLIFCFPDSVVPKCACNDWFKLVWYILLASPNYIWCRNSTYALIITALIGGVGIVYFINMIIVSVYINPKLRQYGEKLDGVGLAAMAEEPAEEIEDY